MCISCLLFSFVVRIVYPLSSWVVLTEPWVFVIRALVCWVNDSCHQLCDACGGLRSCVSYFALRYGLLSKFLLCALSIIFVVVFVHRSWGSLSTTVHIINNSFVASFGSVCMSLEAFFRTALCDTVLARLLLCHCFRSLCLSEVEVDFSADYTSDDGLYHQPCHARIVCGGVVEVVRFIFCFLLFS